MAITAAMVKELRESTGAGMMDAKKALTETNGDMEAATDLVAHQRVWPRPPRNPAARLPEGLVAVAVEGGKGVAV